MARVERLSIDLTPEMASTLRQAIESGEFASASEVIGQALREWSARRDLTPEVIAYLRMAWQEGIESGPSQPMDMNRVRALGREMLEKKS